MLCVGRDLQRSSSPTPICIYSAGHRESWSAREAVVLYGQCQAVSCKLGSFRLGKHWNMRLWRKSNWSRELLVSQESIAKPAVPDRGDQVLHGYSLPLESGIFPLLSSADSELIFKILIFSDLYSMSWRRGYELWASSSDCIKQRKFKRADSHFP